MVSNLHHALNPDQKQTDVIIMDFAKAFDKFYNSLVCGTLPHRRLLYKLDCYGIRGSTHKWISSWLSEHSQKVALDGQASDPVLSDGSCVAGALSRSAFLRFVQSMQRFVTRALFKMAAPFDILSIILGRNGYGRNGYWPKWFWAENVQMRP